MIVPTVDELIHDSVGTNPTMIHGMNSMSALTIVLVEQPLLCTLNEANESSHFNTFVH